MAFSTLFLWFFLCALQDFKQRKIANTLTLGGTALALVYGLCSGHTWLGAQLAEGLGALTLALLLTLPGYAMGRLGAGDVKLLAALALASDRHYLLGTLVGAGLSMASWLLIAPLLRGMLPQRLAAGPPAPQRKPAKKLPFAPFLFIGFVAAVYLQSVT